MRLISPSKNHTRGHIIARLASRSPGHLPCHAPRSPGKPTQDKDCHSDSQPSLGVCNFAQPSLLRFRPSIREHLPEQRPALPRISDFLGGIRVDIRVEVLIERLATRHEVT